MEKKTNAAKPLSKTIKIIIILFVATVSFKTILNINKNTYTFDNSKIKINDIINNDDKVTVSIEYTNKAKASTSFSEMYNIKAFQKGVELSKSMDLNDYSNTFKDVQKNSKFDINLTYKLDNKKDKIELEITEKYDYVNNKTIIHKFKLK